MSSWRAVLMPLAACCRMCGSSRSRKATRATKSLFKCCCEGWVWFGFKARVWAASVYLGVVRVIIRRLWPRTVQ